MTGYLEAVLWGLVQGVTEFLPVSSSGHLVLVPEAFGIAPPDLTMSAVLHLGTLVAVVLHYRSDLGRLVRSSSDPVARHILWLLALGTLPLVVVLAVRELVDTLQRSTTAVGMALVVTAVVLWLSDAVRDRGGVLGRATWLDALAVGGAQLLAVVPGISRSGTTITTGMARGLAPREAARLSFLLGIPAIVGGGVVEGVRVVGEGRLDGPLLVGIGVAALSGYVAISGLLRVLEHSGLRPFSWYCLTVGVGAILFL